MITGDTGEMDRSFFAPEALEVAPRLLGATIRVDLAEGAVSLQITEVEAYLGLGSSGPFDAGSHAKNRMTARNASMFGPPGHAYVYFTYGMHYSINLVCGPEGIASGVLLRAGDVTEGASLARSRRMERRGIPLADHQLARGPGNLAAALGITREQHDGNDLFAAPFSITAPSTTPREILCGPRVGVAGVAGGPEFPWRFWVAGAPSVSAFRPGRVAPRR